MENGGASMARPFESQVEQRPEAIALDASGAYWSDRLVDLPPAPQLPLRRDPWLVSKPHFVRREMYLDQPTWRAISARAGQHQLTLSAVLLSCYAKVLSAWGAEPDLTINLTLFDRPEIRPHISQVPADFISLFLVAYRPVSGESWLAATGRIQEQMRRDLDHKGVPAFWVLDELAKRAGLSQVTMPDVSRSPLGAPKGVPNKVAISSTACIWGSTETPQVWFDHQTVEEAAGGVFLHWDADEDLFAEGVIEAMFDAYGRLLEWLSRSAWSQPGCELTPTAQLSVRARVNATQGAESGRLLHEGFVTQVEQSPQRVALICGDGEQITYGELGARTSRMAGLLVSHGVVPGEPVAVTLPKGPEQIAAVLGVLWVGGVYVPVGADQPMLRRNRICAKAGVRVALGGDVEGMAGWPSEVKALDVKEAAKALPLTAPRRVPIESPAYVIFTSGSTGEPKGVEISHRAAVNTVEDINARFEVVATDRVLAVSALDFDLSVYDIFGLLSVGGAVVLLEEEDRREARRWLESVQRHGVTVWNSVPALLDMLLLVTEEGSSGLRLALASGDWVGLDLPKRLRTRWLGCRFIALGGATEAAIWSNAFEVTEVAPGWRSIPYGFPLRNQYFRAVDRQGQDCPDWVAGELWIGGVGLAQGYRGEPEITARQFVQAKGERWYRTGDLGRYWPDGTLEFLGRLDTQVKIRGFRIEPNEIEAVLKEHPAVHDAVVVSCQDKWGDKRLVAYVAGDPSALNATELRDLLKANFPDYMLPSAIVVLEKFPLNSNGKIDRHALPRPVPGRGRSAFTGPRDTLEAQLAAIWESALGLEAIGVTDDFFEICGDSLRAMRIFIEIERTLGKNLPLATLFQMPTIEKLAAAMRQQDWKPQWSPTVAIQSHGSRPPFFCVHGGFGGVLFYGQLARCLGAEQPLYGLQAEGLDGGPIEHKSIREMAAYYIEEMRRVQPRGPYLFGGYSFGGFVAFEIAQQLRAAAEPVALIALFDAFDPRKRVLRFSLAERIKWRLKSLDRSSRGEKLQFLLQCASIKVGASFAKWQEDARNMLSKAKQLNGGAPSTQLRALDLVQRANRRALSAYKLHPYPGRITLFRSQDPGDGYEYPADYGWTQFAKGGIQIHEVPGDHQTIFAQPNVRTLAARLDTCIRAALAESIRE